MNKSINQSIVIKLIKEQNKTFHLNFFHSSQIMFPCSKMNFQKQFSIFKLVKFLQLDRGAIATHVKCQRVP